MHGKIKLPEENRLSILIFEEFSKTTELNLTDAFRINNICGALHNELCGEFPSNVMPKEVLPEVLGGVLERQKAQNQNVIRYEFAIKSAFERLVNEGAKALIPSKKITRPTHYGNASRILDMPQAPSTSCERH